MGLLMADKFELPKEYSIKAKLEAGAGDSAYKKLMTAVEETTDRYAEGGHKVQLKDGAHLKAHLGTLEGHHKAKEAALKSNASAEIPESVTKGLKGSAVSAHKELDVLAEHAQGMGKDIEAHFKAIEKEVVEKMAKDSKFQEEGQKILGALSKEKEQLEELRKNAGGMINHHRAEVHKKSDIQSKGDVQDVMTPAKDSPASQVAKTAEGKRGPLASSVSMAEHEWEKLGKVGRFKEATKQAWSHGGFVRKTGAVVGTGLGVVIVGKGLKNLGRFVGMASPEQDEAGKDIPADVGTLVKSVAQLAGGGAVAYFSLAGGGKGHAIGK